jgi:SagB-type dehydrogenase family enzyme
MGNSGTNQVFDANRIYRLSRFAVIHPVDGKLVLESPLTGKRFTVKSPGVLKLLLALAKPFCAANVLASARRPAADILTSCLQELHEHGYLTAIDSSGVAEEDQGELAHWELHDLLFHARSRYGRNTHPAGGTYRFLGLSPPEPCYRPISSAPQIALPAPDLERLKSADASFTSVLEHRRSVSGFEPLTVQQLGEFLFRTCRVTGEKSGNDYTDKYAAKVYPSGGSLHPLEMYVGVSSCHGLDQALYRYDATQHSLALIRKMDSGVRALFDYAKQSAGGLQFDPPTLFIMSARFRRTAWKYQSIAYRVMLMEVGVLFQTMYLVATSMGLAPRGLGNGDSDLFAKLIQSDYYLETSVGEFMLGRMPTSSR